MKLLEVMLSEPIGIFSLITVVVSIVIISTLGIMMIVKSGKSGDKN